MSYAHNQQPSINEVKLSLFINDAPFIVYILFSALLCDKAFTSLYYIILYFLVAEIYLDAFDGFKLKYFSLLC